VVEPGQPGAFGGQRTLSVPVGPRGRIRITFSTVADFSLDLLRGFTQSWTLRRVSSVARECGAVGRDIMAKTQKRRSISVRGEVYDRVKKYCDSKGISMSAYVEDRILEALGGRGVSTSTGGTQSEINQHFTF
jgi:hypothetical protein